MKKNYEPILIFIVIATVVTFAIAGFAYREDATYIGLLKGDENIFENTKKIEEALNKKVKIIYYDSYEEMLPDILSKKLIIFETPLFEYIVNQNDTIAISSIPTEYILAGTKEPKSIYQVGVSETYISSVLIDSSKQLKGKKITILKIPEHEKTAYLKEHTIDVAIFRNKIPKQQNLKEYSKLSALGIKSDVLVVQKELLLKNKPLASAIFQSFSPKYEELQKLPDAEELKLAVNYLFKIGSIKQRGNYDDYVFTD